MEGAFAARWALSAASKAARWAALTGRPKLDPGRIRPSLGQAESAKLRHWLSLS